MKTLLARILLALALLAPALPASAQFTDQRNYAGASAGTSSAYTITIPNVGATVPQGIPFRWVPHIANPSTATLAIAGGSGAIALCKPSAAGPVALSGGELQTSQPVETLYNGTCHMISTSVDSTVSSLVVPPQGYLTPCPAASPPTGCTAGQSVPTGDVTIGVGQTVTGIVYTTGPQGNQLPIWNGTKYVVYQFSELTLTLASSHLANTLYDVCVFSNAGTPTIVTGPAWTTSTIGSGARGTGAGTAQLAKTNGLWTNAVVISGINGATTYSNIPANQCTVIATMMISGSNGVLTFNVTVGQSRRWPVSNFYNRLLTVVQVQDPTASWAMASASIRASRGDTTNNAIIVSGLPLDTIDIEFFQSMIATPSSNVKTGVGWNSTTVFSGIVPETAADAVAVARYTAQAPLGANQITSLEQLAAGASITMTGAAAMRMFLKFGG